MTHFPQDSENGLALCYEELRSFALGEDNHVQAPRGLALILKQGMAAWTRAWSLPAPLPLSSRNQVNVHPVPKRGLADEVTVVLANMALSNLAEVCK